MSDALFSLSFPSFVYIRPEPKSVTLAAVRTDIGGPVLCVFMLWLDLCSNSAYRTDRGFPALGHIPEHALEMNHSSWVLRVAHSLAICYLQRGGADARSLTNRTRNPAYEKLGPAGSEAIM